MQRLGMAKPDMATLILFQVSQIVFALFPTVFIGDGIICSYKSYMTLIPKYNCFFFVGIAGAGSRSPLFQLKAASITQDKVNRLVIKFGLNRVGLGADKGYTSWRIYILFIILIGSIEGPISNQNDEEDINSPAYITF